MHELHDDAFLLRSIPYSDSSLILHCLTAKHGRITLMARGARRAKSPFRAGLMPLHHLQIRWKPARTSGMGTLLEVQRLNALLPEHKVLTGQHLLAMANTLFPEGVRQGFSELATACRMLAERPERAGLCAATWFMLETSGWIGQMGYCWQCDCKVAVEQPMYWQQGLMLCSACANRQGIPLHTGFRKSLTGLMREPHIRLQQQQLRTWQHMIDDVLHHHHTD